jgi:hypothetical protein
MLFFELVAMYLIAGLCVAAAFALFGAHKCALGDARVSAPARILLIPGATLLWPLVLVRWLRASPAT